ncbi:hypothetical protein ACHBGV_10055, partial [Streptococcus sp. A34]
MKNSKIGTFITLVAGIAWGLSGVSGQYLMTRGVTVEMITTLRLVISGVVLLGVAYLTSRDQLMAVLKNKHTKISSEEISDGRKYSLLFLYDKV